MSGREFDPSVFISDTAGAHPKTVIEPLDGEMARVSSVLHREPVVLPILSEDADPSAIGAGGNGGGFGSFVRLQDHLSAEAVQVLAGRARRYRSGNQLLMDGADYLRVRANQGRRVMRGRSRSGAASVLGYVDFELQRSVALAECYVPSHMLVPAVDPSDAVLGSADAGVFAGSASGWDSFLGGLPSESVLTAKFFGCDALPPEVFSAGDGSVVAKYYSTGVGAQDEVMMFTELAPVGRFPVSYPVAGPVLDGATAVFRYDLLLVLLSNLAQQRARDAVFEGLSPVLEAASGGVTPVDTGTPLLAGRPVVFPDGSSGVRPKTRLYRAPAPEHRELMLWERRQEDSKVTDPLRVMTRGQVQYYLRNVAGVDDPGVISSVDSLVGLGAVELGKKTRKQLEAEVDQKIFSSRNRRAEERVEGVRGDDDPRVGRDVIETVHHYAAPNLSVHGGPSYGVTPRMLWSHGRDADFTRLQAAYGKNVADTGGVASTQAVLLNPAPSSYEYDFDGRLSRMSVEEIRNFQAFDENKTWIPHKTNPNLTAPAWVPETKEQYDDRMARTKEILMGERRYQPQAPRLTYKHLDVVEFLALFGWAHTRHLGRMFDDPHGTIHSRLMKMEQDYKLIKANWWNNSKVWTLTDLGVGMSGYDISEIDLRKVSPQNVGHNMVLHYVAACLWGGTFDVLQDPAFPARNRRRGWGQSAKGDVMVPDRVIDSSLAGMRVGMKADQFRPMIRQEIDVAFRRWEDEGGAAVNSVSPELFTGNEYMLALYPPRSVGNAYHVPDLVLKRPRSVDGSPNSVAVEVEIGHSSTRQGSKVDKAIEAYAADDRIFGEVVWVTHRPSIADRIKRKIQKLGVQDRIRVVPLMVPEGVFPPSRSPWEI